MDRRKNIQRKTLGSAATIPGHAIYQFSLQLWQMLHMLRRDGTRGLVFVFSLEVAPVSEGDCFTCSGETAPRPAAGQARRFLFWGIFSHARSLGTTQRGGALLLFVLRAVAGACVGRWTGQPRMPPRERLHEGFLVWGIFSHAREWMAREG